jgi:hypothetical protein
MKCILVGEDIGGRSEICKQGEFEELGSNGDGTERYCRQVAMIGVRSDDSKKHRWRGWAQYLCPGKVIREIAALENHPYIATLYSRISKRETSGRVSASGTAPNYASTSRPSGVKILAESE